MKLPSSENGKVKRSYRKWSSMLRRCYSKKAHNWKYYGGRGIEVCPRWKDRWHGYRNFVTDMGEPPDGLTLERINNDLGYSPENCKWATMHEQLLNRRPSSRPVDPKSINQQAIKAGQKYIRVILRMRRGWTLQEALHTPVMTSGRQVGWTKEYGNRSLRQSGGTLHAGANTEAPPPAHPA